MENNERENEQALEAKIVLARIDERTLSIDKKVDAIKADIESNYVRKDVFNPIRDSHVTKEEFIPVRNIVYGIVGIMLTSVLVAILTLVMRGGV